MCLAIPGQVEEIFEDCGTTMGRINFGGVVKNVCLTFVPNIEVGDFAIVHVGFAISQIDEESARQSLQAFAELGLLEAELDELRASSGVPGSPMENHQPNRDTP